MSITAIPYVKRRHRCPVRSSGVFRSSADQLTLYSTVALRPRDIVRLGSVSLTQEIIDYTHGLGLISQRITDTTYFRWDARATARQIEDSAGATRFTELYDAFGLLRSNQTLVSAYGFVGEQGVRGEKGLNPSVVVPHHMRARMYDPLIGRFVSRDPVWSENLYDYASGNPWSNIDPDGNAPTPPGVTDWILSDTARQEHLDPVLHALGFSTQHLNAVSRQLIQQIAHLDVYHHAQFEQMLQHHSLRDIAVDLLDKQEHSFAYEEMRDGHHTASAHDQHLVMQYHLAGVLEQLGFDPGHLNPDAAWVVEEIARAKTSLPGMASFPSHADVLMGSMILDWHVHHQGRMPLAGIDVSDMSGLEEIAGLFPLGWDIRPLANYSAGGGDSLSMGGTGLVREGLGFGDSVDENSAEYRAGGYTEFAVEIAATGGAIALNRMAERAFIREGTRIAANFPGRLARSSIRELGMEEVRRQSENLARQRAARELGVTRTHVRRNVTLHHNHSLAGHPPAIGTHRVGWLRSPGRFKTLFPSGGLGPQLNAARWNITVIQGTRDVRFLRHARLHSSQYLLERLGVIVVNPLTTAARGYRQYRRRRR